MMAFSLLPIFQWLSVSFAGRYIQRSQFAVPLIGNFHLLGWVTLMGIVLAVNLTVLNVIKLGPPSRIARELWPYFLLCISVVGLTGVLLISSNAISYYYNPILRAKLGAASIAVLIFTIIVRRLKKEAQAISTALRSLAAIDLGLWFLTLIAGRVVGLY